MATSDSTCRTMIRAAAGDSVRDRAAFARRYGPIIRTNLATRWRAAAHLRQLETRSDMEDVYDR